MTRLGAAFQLAAFKAPPDHNCPSYDYYPCHTSWVWLAQARRKLGAEQQAGVLFLAGSVAIFKSQSTCNHTTIISLCLL